jgi:hypothetical protein
VLVALGIPDARDGIVQGTEGNDLIDVNYLGDPDGDLVDNGDATNGYGVPGSDDDRIEAGAGDDTVIAGAGDDSVFGGTGDDSVLGGAGNDSIIGSEGSDYVEGGDGDDFINTRTSPGLGVPDVGLVYPDDPSTIDNETLLYSYPSDTDPTNDLDTVYGGLGNDTILTGDDDDLIYGGVGNDVIDAGFDDDSVFGGEGADSIQASEGADTVFGEDGDDIIYGGLSPLDPNYAASAIYDLEDDGTNTSVDPITTNNTDLLYGGAGNDQIFGQDDSDTLYGGIGNDTLDGGIDDDLLFGDEGIDLLIGGHGNDTLDGGDGDNTLTGGTGNDTFVWDGSAGTVVTDWQFGATGSLTDGDQTNNDFLDLSTWYNTTTLTSVNGAGGNYGNALAMLRDDAADGLIDGIIGGVDYAALLGITGSLELQGLDAGAGGNLTSDTVNVVCFVRGTHIKTIEGEVAIEDLEEGDLVLTLDNSYRPIRWIGSTCVPGKGHLAPIRIAAGALENARDLWVSPQHRMCLRHWRSQLLFGERETLAAAKHLVNDSTIRQIECEQVEYFHILFDEHEIIFAEGAASESFHPGSQGLSALSKETRAEIVELFPQLETEGTNAFGQSARWTLKAHEVALLMLADTP